MSAGCFHYRSRRRAGGARPGAHPSRRLGGGSAFYRHVGVLDAPDARRFDVRASLCNPYGELLFRVAREPAAVPVYALADLSASLGYRGVGDKLAALADFTAALAFSAYRSGDPFGFVGCGETVLADFIRPPGFACAEGLALAERVRGYRPCGRSAAGLLDGARLLGRRRGLVFVLSDFHLPWPQIDALLALLAGHETVPVVFWDDAEYRELPRFGLARLRDGESGRERLALLRPALRRRLSEDFERRRARLRALCLRHGCRPLFMPNRFDADAVSRYFYAD